MLVPMAVLLSRRVLKNDRRCLAGLPSQYLRGHPPKHLESGSARAQLWAPFLGVAAYAREWSLSTLRTALFLPSVYPMR
jgi:hypothetical protein